MSSSHATIRKAGCRWGLHRATKIVNITAKVLVADLISPPGPCALHTGHVVAGYRPLPTSLCQHQIGDLCARLNSILRSMTYCCTNSPEARPCHPSASSNQHSSRLGLQASEAVRRQLESKLCCTLTAMCSQVDLLTGLDCV
jgi:hypothetical protein